MRMHVDSNRFSTIARYKDWAQVLFFPHHQSTSHSVLLPAIHQTRLSCSQLKMFAPKVAALLLSLSTAALAAAIETSPLSTLAEYNLSTLDTASKNIILNSIREDLDAAFPGLGLTCSLPAEAAEKRQVHGETEHRRVLAEAESKQQAQLGDCSTSSNPATCRICVGAVGVAYVAALGACSASAMGAEVETAGVWSIPVWTAYTSCTAGSLAAATTGWSKCY